jgi:WD40 repeat protein
VVRLWDLAPTPPLRQTFRLFPSGNRVAGVAFGPEGRHLATANPDGSVYLFRLAPAGPLAGLPRPDATAAEVRAFVGHQGWIGTVAFDRAGGRAFSVGQDGTARIWGLGGKERHCLRHPKPVHRLALTPDDQFLVTTCEDEVVRIWDTASGVELGRLEGLHRAVPTVVVSPLGAEVYTVGADGAGVLSNLATGKQRLRLPGNAGAAAFTPDGNALLLNHSNRVELLDVRTGKLLLELEGFTPCLQVQVLTVSPDGKYAASASGTMRQPEPNRWADCAVRLWDLRTGREVWRRQENTHTRWGVRFTPDGRRVVAGSADGTVRVYDAETGEEQLCIDEPSGVGDVAVSADGGFVLAATGRPAVVLYRLPAAKER